jgi:NDP-sugar pyrophosphorylase family protein
MKAMILAAGRGTRMLPLTENTPKPLIEVQGVPLLQHTIQYLKFYGVTEIIINVHHFPEQIIDFVKKNGHFGIRIEFSFESDTLLDTGGGLYKARHFFNDNKPFILTSSDVITDLNLSELYEFHKQNNPIATLAVKHRNSSRDFIFDENHRLCGWHNNMTGETRLIRSVEKQIRIGFSTIHMINPVLFGLMTERDSFSIVDVYLRLAPEYPILGFEHNMSAWFECGRIENLEALNRNPEIDSLYKKYHRL